jgi:hypothetical protein
MLSIEHVATMKEEEERKKEKKKACLQEGRRWWTARRNPVQIPQAVDSMQKPGANPPSGGQHAETRCKSPRAVDSALSEYSPKTFPRPFFFLQRTRQKNKY